MSAHLDPGASRFGCRGAGPRRTLRRVAAAGLLALAAGCSGFVGGPPNLSSDPCLACRQNCSLTGRMCGSSSASEMACRTKLADCEYKCRKRYCPRDKQEQDEEPEQEAAPAGATDESPP